MLSVHFNGEIVRHKDTKKINEDRQLLYKTEGRCKYGIHKTKCIHFNCFCLKEPIINLKQECPLSKTAECPHYKQRKNAGNIQKTYTIDGKTYRKLASAAHWMLKEGEHRTIFLTLSFGAWRRKHKYTKSFIYNYYDQITNQLFSAFVEKLRKNYSCSGYIAVKEYGEHTERVHFHLIACLPYIPFLTLNDCWNDSISFLSHYSNCALRTDKNKSAIIHNANRATRYVCKYLSKQKGRISNTRIVFVSNNIIRKVIKLDESLPRIGYRYLQKYKSLKIKKFEHTTVYNITDRREFEKFCWDFLYPLFECIIKPSRMDYIKANST